VDSSNIDLAKEYIKDEKFYFQCASVNDLPFEDDSIDVVTSWEVLEHIPKNTEHEMFKEISLVLKPGCRFYLSTPFRDIRSNVTDPAWWLIGHRHYSLSDIRGFAEKSGFEVESLTVKGGWGSVGFLLNMYFSKWVLRRSPLFQKFFDRIMDQEYYNRNKGFFGIIATMKKR